MIELIPGTQVRFRDGEGELEGVINGLPYVVWKEGVVDVLVPVHVPSSNRNIAVIGVNIVGVEER